MHKQKCNVPLKRKLQIWGFYPKQLFCDRGMTVFVLFPKMKVIQQKISWNDVLLLCFRLIHRLHFSKNKDVSFISRFSTKKTFSKSFNSEKKPFSRDWGISFSSRVKRPFREASFISVYESNIASQFSKLTFKKGGFRFIWKSFH